MPTAQGEVVQTPSDEARRIGGRVRINQLNVIEPCQQSLETDPGLNAGETRAGTEVFAVTKGDVASCVRLLRIEAGGVLEEARVGIRGTVHRHQDGSHRNVDPGELGVAQDKAKGSLDWALQA